MLVARCIIGGSPFKQMYSCIVWAGMGVHGSSVNGVTYAGLAQAGT